ncbi:hypothetical protein LJC17_04090 [Acholeplasma sp. OttesenSCG-928-E16]|nr:hypothetical protein [Acholeplasma sp. OttesenSCG-928-E16]
MIDHQRTINKLLEGGYITKDDLVVVGSTTPSATQLGLFGALGGAIGGAIAASNIKPYIIAVNPEKIRFFEIDKKTGAFLNRYSEIKKTEIRKIRVGRYRFSLSTLDLNESFQYYKKVNGFNQVEKAKQLNEFMKLNYKK